jgi:hypothetical protein
LPGSFNGRFLFSHSGRFLFGRSGRAVQFGAAGVAEAVGFGIIGMALGAFDGHYLSWKKLGYFPRTL